MGELIEMPLGNGPGDEDPFRPAVLSDAELFDGFMSMVSHPSVVTSPNRLAIEVNRLAGDKRRDDSNEKYSQWRAAMGRLAVDLYAVSREDELHRVGDDWYLIAIDDWLRQTKRKDTDLKEERSAALMLSKLRAGVCTNHELEPFVTDTRWIVVLRGLGVIGTEET